MSSEAKQSSSQPGSNGGRGWKPPGVNELQHLLPQYEILSMLGCGGMGAVYKARQKSLDRIVAIKILPPGLDEDDARFSGRFKNEARTMAKMNHPGIVSVYDFGETAAGQLYLVMEYVDGTDVARMIQSSGVLPPEQALSITAHVCDALAYAHANGVIHRDIKPANILINKQGQVKVADFGLAKHEDPTLTAGLTRTGMAMGTPDFVAPEALTPGMELDGRADLYSVGVMLYQMLTGEIPRGLFLMPSAKTKGETDQHFDRIIRRAMQAEREERYQSAREMRNDLDAILFQSRVRQDAAELEKGVAKKAVQHGDQRHAAENSKSLEANARSKGPIFIGLAATLAIIGSIVVLLGDKNGKDTSKPADEISVASAGGGLVWRDFIAALDRTSPGLPPNCVIDGTSVRIGGDKADLELRIADGSFEDAALRATFRGGGSDLILNLRHERTNDKIQARIESNGVVTMNYWESEAKTELAKITLPASFAFGDLHTVEFRAQGDHLTLVLDGAEVLVGRQGAVTSGRISLRADPGAVFEKIEWRELPAPTRAIDDAERTGTAGAPVVFAGHRYQFVPDPTLLWSEAKVKAEAMGGHLATITSQEENDWIARTFIETLPVERGLWIGGARGKGGQWSWVTGEPFQFQKWLPVENEVGEPALLFLHSTKRGVGWVDTQDTGIVGQNRDRDFRAGYLVEWDAAEAAVSGARAP